jgi:aspartate/methionine/tyrosine aminotransferase
MDPPIVEIEKLLPNKEKTISFGQGVPFFHPSNGLMKKFWTEIKNNQELHHYTPDLGFTKVRKRVEQYLSNYYNKEISWLNVILTSGGNTAFYNVLSVIIEPKDEVLIISPYYFNHIMALQLLYANPIYIETSYEKQFIPETEVINEKLTDKTKAIVLISPNNPTGAVYKEGLIEKMLDICEERDLFLILDETYSEFIYKDNRIIKSYFHRNSERLVHIGTFSKNFGLSGWRIGYLVLPTNLKQAYLKIQDTITIAPPSVSQLLVDFLIKNNIDLVSQHMQDLVESRNLMRRKIEENSLFEVTSTSGALYFFVKLNTSTNGEIFAKKLASDYNIVVIPGNVFGSSYNQFIRFSFGSLSKSLIEKGFNKINSFCEELV